MDGTQVSPVVAMGARFFDDKRHDMGRAARVAKRPPALGRLTVIDVVLPEPPLAAYLRSLDKGRLVICCDGESGATYTFTWASGYANGNEIRIQGILE